MNYIRFPFGKYKGVYIDDLPTSYIAYALEKFDLPDELEAGLRRQLVSRLKFTDAHSVREIYRTLAMKYHPDRGGSDLAFQALNEFYTRICDAQ